MDNPNCSTEHRKNQHLTAEERHEIEVRLKDGWSVYRIARHLQRPYNTIKNEIQRGTVVLYNGRTKRYKAQEGERVYKEHRSRCRRPYLRLRAAPFIRYVEAQFAKGWSLDAIVGRAQLEGRFNREDRVCTKTLYNYVDIGLINIKNIDLPDKLRRNTKKARVRKNKKLFGDSISQRPERIESREEFGHWEIDSVIGSQDESEPAVLTLVERKLRYSVWMKIERHTAGSVQNALNQLFSYFGEKASEVFKTITGDNGSEFSLLSELKEKDIRVFFTHPYSSWEKGTNERHNGLLRRFIPKGESISNYSAEELLFIADWANGLPRKILGYHTPEELFEKELDRIFAA